MTKEEIIDGLEIYTVGRLNKDRVHITVEELQKFIDEIKALSQECVGSTQKHVGNALEMRCDDAISREAVEECKELMTDINGDTVYAVRMSDIRQLLSVTPQQKYEDIAKAFQLGLAFGFGEKYDEMDKVIEEIKKVITPQPKTGHWIPVNEELPKIADCYAVTRKIGSDLIVDACFFDGTNTWHKDNYINHERNYLTNIVAWMPLPEPYEPQEGSDKE